MYMYVNCLTSCAGIQVYNVVGGEGFPPPIILYPKKVGNLRLLHSPVHEGLQVLHELFANSASEIPTGWPIGDSDLGSCSQQSEATKPATPP